MVVAKDPLVMQIQSL